MAIIPAPQMRHGEGAQLAKTGPYDRWAILFETIALPMLTAVLASRDRRARLRDLITFLVPEAADPNRKSLPLAVRAQRGIVAFA